MPDPTIPPELEAFRDDIRALCEEHSIDWQDEYFKPAEASTDIEATKPFQTKIPVVIDIEPYTDDNHAKKVAQATPVAVITIPRDLHTLPKSFFAELATLVEGHPAIAPVLNHSKGFKFETYYRDDSERHYQHYNKSIVDIKYARYTDSLIVHRLPVLQSAGNDDDELPQPDRFNSSGGHVMIDGEHKRDNGRIYIEAWSENHPAFTVQNRNEIKEGTSYAAPRAAGIVA